MDLSSGPIGASSSPARPEPFRLPPVSSFNTPMLPSFTAHAPMLSSPSLRPIAIAPKPISPMETPIKSSPATVSGFQSVNAPKFTEVSTPVAVREYWTEAEKYDLLWSIVLSTGTTMSSIQWDRISVPRGHSQESAALVVQDIAFGKHHITHPTFTPSNAHSSAKARPRASSNKKRKLEEQQQQQQQQEEEEVEVGDSAGIIPEPREASHTATDHSGFSSSPSNQELDNNNDNSTSTSTKPKPRRRRRSESPPIELDFTNPRIVQYLKREGYMNEDGTPAKKKRGRPTKDPFGLSVTLKKKLLLLDPNAPPAKKRGRPRKRFLDIDLEFGGADGDGDENVSDRRMEGEGSISPGLRKAIEQIGEEMDRDVEELLDEGRRMRDDGDDDDGDDVSEESESYEGSGAEGWEDDSDEAADGRGDDNRTGNEDGKLERRGSYMMVDGEDVKPVIDTTSTSSTTNDVKAAEDQTTRMPQILNNQAV